MKNRIKRKLRSIPITCFFIYVIEYCLWHTIRRVGFNLILFIKSKIVFRNPNYELLRDYKNIHKGEKCIIVGNGPSIRYEELDLIKQSGIDSFGANRIVDIWDNTEWRPNYMCVMDPGFLIGSLSTITPIQYISILEENGIENIFFTHRLKNTYKKAYDVKANISYVFCPQAKLFSKKLMPFSDDITQYISDLGSVTHFSIQLACYMGYETIYLYGIDNAYKKYLDNDGKFVVDIYQDSHVKGMGKGVEDELTTNIPKNMFEAFKGGGFADIRKNNLGYNFCIDYAKKHHVEIVNLTNGGKLEVFKREKINADLLSAL